MRALFIGTVAALLLSGCAINIVGKAPDSQISDDMGSVVTGRMNYVIDGKTMTPYGAFRPAWPAPFMNAVSLQTGEVHAFPAVADEDGSFRWLVKPGAYVVTRIGFGNLIDETFIAWPRVALCIPRAVGATVYVGHLRLEGTRYAEHVALSTGTRYAARGVRYTFSVADEAAGNPGQIKRLMRHVPDMPIGDDLVTRWKANPAELERSVCGDLFGDLLR
jgi:hypothetical protein